ncbi:hypothetical protein N431DRAFT_554189 [Stipitochalara longipes BDJ]|nr:hypothetical protein N431DRAFT_554189 [Stipitochalara longipes BDJ]
MEAPPPVAPISPPPLPEGWKAEWSAQYNTWFYLNPAGASQWEYPGPPPQQQLVPVPTNNALPTPPLQYSPIEQPQYPAGQEVSQPADGDKGLGKVGGGLLGAAGGLLAGAFVAHEIDEHKQHHHHNGFFGVGKLPLAAAGAGGLLGTLSNNLPFGKNSGSRPQQPQPQTAPAHGFGGFMPSAFGGGNAPRLNIHCAAYCDQDVTNAVRSMIQPGQIFEIDTYKLVETWGDPWPDNRKQFSVLYSYGDRPWELAAGSERNGLFALRPHQPLDRKRMEFVQDPRQCRIIALVWGEGNGLEHGKGKLEKLRQIETTGEFDATNSWMGFDGMCGPAKTAVVYYRAPHGAVAIACARENGTCRLPWNPLAKWT